MHSLVLEILKHGKMWGLVICISVHYSKFWGTVPCDLRPRFLIASLFYCSLEPCIASILLAGRQRGKLIVLLFRQPEGNSINGPYRVSPCYLPFSFVRFGVAETFRKRVAGNFQLSYLPTKQSVLNTNSRGKLRKR